MAKAYASAIIDAPIEHVWGLLRDFNGLPNWHPAIVSSKIEGGLDADVVGCVRAFKLADGKLVRERLLSFDDARWRFSYNFEPDAPAFPVENYVATVRLYPVTKTNQTFAEWTAVFDEAPGDKGKYVDIITNGVFQAGWTALKAKLAKMKAKDLKTPEGPRWKGGQPNKVWTSAVLHAPVERAWGVMRDFAGMGDWHAGITKMHMLEGKRSDKVSGTRDFYFGPGHLHEQLLHLDDTNWSFSYRITKCELPWINYRSGPRLWPITETNETFAVWTGDWDASAQDDLVLMPTAENEVYQQAFTTLNEKHFSKKPKTAKGPMKGEPKAPAPAKAATKAPAKVAAKTPAKASAKAPAKAKSKR